MPEPKEAKGYPKIDTKSEEDPVEVSKTFGRLKVIGEEEVVRQGDGEPHQVGAVEEEGAGDQPHPPAGRRHVRGLGGHPGGLGLVSGHTRAEEMMVLDTISPGPPRPGFQRRIH